MNAEKKGNHISSAIPIIDLTMDDGNESELLPRSNNAVLTKEAFQEKEKGNTPAAQGLRARCCSATSYQEKSRLDNQVGVQSCTSELREAETSGSASMFQSELTRMIWELRTEDWRLSEEKVAEAKTMFVDPCRSQQSLGTDANYTMVGNSVRRICGATTSINIKESPENLHGCRSEGRPSREPIMVGAIERTCKTSNEQSARTEMSTIAWMNRSSLDNKPGTPVVGESSSYPKLIRISGITSRTPPADPRLRARIAPFEPTPSKFINIPLMNKSSNSVNIQKPPKNICRPWE